MAKKDSVFDTLITYLCSHGVEKDFFGQQKRVDDLALSHVRFVHQRLRESELSDTEKKRAIEALHKGYAAVDPAYSGEQEYLSDFDGVLNPKTEEALHKKPTVPMVLDDLLIGSSPADRQLDEVAQKIRGKRAYAKVRA
jgi:hypothetical protein